MASCELSPESARISARCDSITCPCSKLIAAMNKNAMPMMMVSLLWRSQSRRSEPEYIGKVTAGKNVFWRSKLYALKRQQKTTGFWIRLDGKEANEPVPSRCRYPQGNSRLQHWLGRIDDHSPGPTDATRSGLAVFRSHSRPAATWSRARSAR